MKLVSVIIPCYKNSQTLSRAINSVISQSYSSIEIIVVNDCSPESKEIEAVLLDYLEVRYLRNPVNVGPAVTRNIGLAFANGEIVAFLDADDEYHPEKIELQVAALDEKTVVTCGLTRIFHDGKMVHRKGVTSIVEDPKFLLYRNKLNGAGLLSFRDLLLQHGGYDPTLLACEDWDLYLRLLSAGVKVKVISQPLYFYYSSPLSLSANKDSNYQWGLAVLKNHSTRMDKNFINNYLYAFAIILRMTKYLVMSDWDNRLDKLEQVIYDTKMLKAYPILRRLFILLVRSRILFLFTYVYRFKHRLTLV